MYAMERRGRCLTELAHCRLPDGSLPPQDLIGLALAQNMQRRDAVATKYGSLAPVSNSELRANNRRYDNLKRSINVLTSAASSKFQIASIKWSTSQFFAPQSARFLTFVSISASLIGSSWLPRA
jgi:hypothetical protein